MIDWTYTRFEPGELFARDSDSPLSLNLITVICKAVQKETNREAFLIEDNFGSSRDFFLRRYSDQEDKELKTIYENLNPKLCYKWIDEDRLVFLNPENSILDENLIHDSMLEKLRGEIFTKQEFNHGTESWG